MPIEPPGLPVPIEPSGRPVPIEPPGLPVPIEPSGRPVPIEPPGLPVPIEPSGRPVPIEPPVLPVPIEPSGRPVPIEPSGLPVPIEPSGRPVPIGDHRLAAGAHRAIWLAGTHRTIRATYFRCEGSFKCGDFRSQLARIQCVKIAAQALLVAPTASNAATLAATTCEYVPSLIYPQFVSSQQFRALFRLPSTREHFLKLLVVRQIVLVQIQPDSHA